MHKKEVILVNLPPGRNFSYEDTEAIYPATGIMIIGTVLRKIGVPVSIIDGAINPDYENLVLDKISENTAFVGFSTMTSQIVMAYKLAKKIKEKQPDTLIIFGGIHPTLFPEQTARNPYIDIAVINEGAKTVLEIMDFINKGKELSSIKGIAFSDKEGRVNVTQPRELDNISDIPHFDFELLDVPRYLDNTSIYERELKHNEKDRVRLMPILSGLGCCFRCSFCINVVLKRRYRTRSARSIIDEIKRLKSAYGANAFLFYDEDFCIDKKRLKEFIELAKGENIKFSCRIWSRVSYFKQDGFKRLVPEMKSIGIGSITMGAESGSQRVLDYMKKDIKLEDIICAAEEVSKAGMMPRFSFIAGIFGERKEETAATYRLCSRLFRISDLLDIPLPSVYRAFPGSPIFNEIVDRYNIKLPAAIEEWEDVMNDDGSLIMDARKWTWPGLVKYHENMRSYIALYTKVRDKGYSGIGLLDAAVRQLALWRLARGVYGYNIDYYMFRYIRGLKGILSKRFRKEKAAASGRNPRSKPSHMQAQTARFYSDNYRD